MQARKRGKAYRNVSAPAFIDPCECVFDSQRIPVGKVSPRWGEPENSTVRIRPSLLLSATERHLDAAEKTHAWIAILGSVRCEASITTPNADPPPPRRAKNRSWFLHSFAVRKTPSGVTTFTWTWSSITWTKGR